MRRNRRIATNQRDLEPALPHHLRKRGILDLLALPLVPARLAAVLEREEVADLAGEGAGGDDGEADAGAVDEADDWRDDFVAEERGEGDDEEDGDEDEPAGG